MSGDGGLYNDELTEKDEYIVSNVTFEAAQSEDGSTVKVTPSATVTLNGETLASDKVQYTVYLNDKEYATNTFETPSVDVELTNGMINEIYVKVTPVDSTNVSGTSSRKEFAYGVEIETVAFTLNFKSSSSYRYRPKVQIGDKTVEMTKSGNAISRNSSQTQSYYWYTATVNIEKDKATKLVFTNGYSMNAAVTLTLSEDKTYYYGVDNLNNGATAVDLTDAEQYIRDFVKSATHMVYNDAYDAGVATTSIDGKIYKMGDSDMDNVVSIIDATEIQRALAQKTELSETATDLSDFDLDSTTSIMDATLVQVYLAQGK